MREVPVMDRASDSTDERTNGRTRRKTDGWMRAGSDEEMGRVGGVRRAPRVVVCSMTGVTVNRLKDTGKTSKAVGVADRRGRGVGAASCLSANPSRGLRYGDRFSQNTTCYWCTYCVVTAVRCHGGGRSPRRRIAVASSGLRHQPWRWHRRRRMVRPRRTLGNDSTCGSTVPRASGYRDSVRGPVAAFTNRGDRFSAGDTIMSVLS